MPTFGLDNWPILSPYLEKALAMTESERTPWLSLLREQNPALADQLSVLLEEHRVLSDERFLENCTVEMPALGLSGQVLGSYELRETIGHGGMGTVWLAERKDGRFERKVAVKLLNLSLMGKSGEERFKQEGAILGRLTHPHIAELLDAGLSPAGQPYLALEYVEGEQIDRYCDRHTLDGKARIRLFLDVLDAVAHAHRNLIVHRDIKPPNVLVRNDGQVKLLDFGIAKLLAEKRGAAAPTALTVGGVRPMTPEYAAPEQLRNEAVTTATDVYSLGVLLYLLLTGQHPAGSRTNSIAELVEAIVETDPMSPSDVVVRNPASAEVRIDNAKKRATTPDRLSRLLRGDLDVIVAKALKKDQTERYSSVTVMAGDLRRYLRNEPISARPDAFTYRCQKFARRHRVAVALTSLAIAATSAGLTGTMMEARKARTQRDFAFRQLARAESINDLDDFLLADAAPSGKPFSVNQLLERAEHVVERKHEGNAADRIELLISIGRKYEGQDEDGKARKLLEQAYQSSRGVTDKASRADASCALASALARSDLPRARSLVDEGLRELPEDPQYVLNRVTCLLASADVANESGASDHAIARGEAAKNLLAGSLLPSKTTDLRVQMNLAESYSSAGRYREAIPVFENVSALMTDLGCDDTESAGTLFNNWALALHLSGRPLEAEKFYRRAMDINRTSQSDENVSPMLLVNYARTLRELGRGSEAASYADGGYAKAQRSGDQVVMNQALLLRARIYRDQGNFAGSQAMLAEVEPRLRTALPPGHLAFATLASEQSLLAFARGDLVAASRQANQALAITQASIAGGHGGDEYLPYLLIVRSDIERELGQTDEAVSDAGKALSALQKAAEPGAFSNSLGHAYFSLGRALQKQDKSERARPAFLSAAEHFENTLGKNHPDTLMARQMAHSNTYRR
jgi:serine/threonine-protein kinase